jgi:hypothetical protein
LRWTCQFIKSGIVLRKCEFDPDDLQNSTKQFVEIKMATTQAAYAAEKAIGHDDNNVTAQDVTNYKQTGDPNETMKALVWTGKNKVEMGKRCL